MSTQMIIGIVIGVSGFVAAAIVFVSLPARRARHRSGSATDQTEGVADPRVRPDTEDPRG